MKFPDFSRFSKCVLRKFQSICVMHLGCGFHFQRGKCFCIYMNKICMWLSFYLRY
ncbi:hypothetical protein X975_00660, partial [Stegodyphus mimosarum]